jgi:hypothetical protein
LKLEKKIGIRNLKEMLEKENYFPHFIKVRTLLQKLFHPIMTYRSYKTQEVELLCVWLSAFDEIEVQMK